MAGDYNREMRLLSVLFAAILVNVSQTGQGAVLAPFGTSTGSPTQVRLGEEHVSRYKIGVVIQAVGGPCRGIIATIPVPADWPEQTVRIFDEDVSANVGQVSYQMLEGGVKQMVVSIALLQGGDEAHAMVTVEVNRRTLIAPEDTSQFVLPKQMDRQTRRFLAPSPYIESRHGRIRKLAKEITKDQESAWEKVESIYDWVRENVDYQNGKLKGALAALRDGTGDCEELTSLFIALCRANGIPARTVWVPGHCYPEFYLADETKQGHWIPCQAAGSHSFGGIVEQRPVLQKGDNFRVPGSRTVQRYVAEKLKVAAATGKPAVRFVRENMAE